MATTYKQAGVNIRAGTDAVNRCKEAIRATHGPNVICGVGAFGGGILLPDGKTVLVQSIDGVGTKIKLAVAAGDCSTVGADIVHHSVNDIVVQGASAYTFLDYFATAELDPEQMSQAVIGAANACKALGIAMTGGETAEMPGVYMPDVFDLAGCISGLVDRDKVITGEDIKVGDMLIGIGSNGAHTNGYSLIRKLFDKQNLTVNDMAPWNPAATVGEEVLRVHRCYDRPMKIMINAGVIRGAAHITGGGIPGNLIRVLPRGCRAMVDFSAWEKQSLFGWIQEVSGNKLPKMLEAFNMGIGMIVIVRKEDADNVLTHLTVGCNEKAWVIGEIIRGRRSVKVV